MKTQAMRTVNRQAVDYRRPLPIIDFSVHKNSVNLLAQSAGSFLLAGEKYEIPRLVFVGPQGGGEPIALGIFAGIHGDEPEGVHAVLQFIEILENSPELARGYCLFFYPLCNPTGFEDRTRHSRNGKDLNREFWKGSAQAEVAILEQEIKARRFHGIISLHTDNTSEGFYGFARGATLTKHLLNPALRATEAVVPRDRRGWIDGFQARDGLIKDCYAGVLSSQPGVRPKPFEIILESPQKAPQFQQQQAFILALNTILAEYRKLIAYAANL